MAEQSTPPVTEPARARVRMYNVGFGDCFLLSFEYARALDDGRRERHLLFDFGTMSRGRNGPTLPEVAELIREHCRGRLDVVVVSHRHRDHLSGFADEDAWPVIEGLAPRLVVRPWTEDPEADERARAPQVPRDPSLRFLRAIAEGQDYARALHDRLERERKALDGTPRQSLLEQMAFEELSNREAVDRLNRLAGGAQAEYLHAGMASRIGEAVPGIEVTVLGPPTVEQWEEVAEQREENPEYWMFYSGLGPRERDPGYWAFCRDQLRKRAMRGLPLAAQQAVPGAEVSEGEPDGGAEVAIAGEEAAPAWRNPGRGQQRWIIERLRRERSASLLRIVRILDDALNNTSLILLIRARGKRLLFCGDAQIENWNYALKNPAVSEGNREELALVDLYKVGHHGSRNGTPRSLHALWAARNGGEPRMAALMSTKSGVHGKAEATAVPRRTLVEALRQVAAVHSTEDLGEDEPFAEVAASLSGAGRFERVGG